jgi:hypothetical protein
MRQGDVYDSVRRLARRLADERIDYAVIGGLAVVEHGYRRATEHIDVLLTEDGLRAERLDPSVRAEYQRLWQAAQNAPAAE